MNVESAPSVLIVDDDDAVRHAVARYLRAEGLQVREAINGVDALRQLRTDLVSAILLDLRMPVMDGWAFRREQRLDPAIAGVPVIVMSGADGDRIDELAPAAAFEKPVQIADVVEVLYKILDR